MWFASIATSRTVRLINMSPRRKVAAAILVSWARCVSRAISFAGGGFGNALNVGDIDEGGLLSDACGRAGPAPKRRPNALTTRAVASRRYLASAARLAWGLMRHRAWPIRETCS